MTFISGSMVFLVIWWVVLLAVLPFGVQTEDSTGKGFASSAPKNPNLGKKFLATTLITAIIWVILHFMMIHQWVSLS